MKNKIKTEPVEQEECETIYGKLFVLEENDLMPGFSTTGTIANENKP